MLSLVALTGKVITYLIRTMSNKYDSLKKSSDENIFPGDKFIEQLSSFSYENGVAVIQGLPPCPECGKILIHIFLKGTWYCSGCGTRWDDASLVKALQNERAIAELKEEEDNGDED